jgi:transcriptional regulator with XRE-family HTH domain
LKRFKFDNTKLRELRENAGLSVYKSSKELSNSGLDVSHQTIMNWEAGKSTPNCNQLADLALFYGKPVGYFFVKLT